MNVILKVYQDAYTRKVLKKLKFSEYKPYRKCCLSECDLTYRKISQESFRNADFGGSSNIRKSNQQSQKPLYLFQQILSNNKNNLQPSPADKVLITSN